MDEEKGGVLKKGVDILYKIVELFSCLCLAGQIVIISYAVFTRYVLNSSPSWAEEISRVLMIWMSLLTVSWQLRMIPMSVSAFWIRFLKEKRCLSGMYFTPC